jgi:hypothetical protein
LALVEHIKSQEHMRPVEIVPRLARLRESSARFAVEISQRLLYTEPGDVPPEFVETFESQDECYRLGKETVEELRQIIDIPDPENWVYSIYHIFRIAGEMKGLFMRQREEFKVVMAASIDDLSARHDIDIPKAKIRINEEMGMLGNELAGITKVDFVVHPLIMRYGDVRNDLDPLLRTIENPPELVWMPHVLCQQHGKRRREWDGMSKAAKKASIKDANAERGKRYCEEMARIRDALSKPSRQG